MTTLTWTFSGVFQSYENIIAKDAKVGAQVERVSATDDDIGKNAAIIYTLEAIYPDTALDFFAIDQHTGIISLTSPLADVSLWVKRI